MPQLDLDHLVRIGASGHRENNCGMAAAPSLPASVDDGGNVSASARDDDGDGPAESVLLRARDGAGLAELFCAALRRDRSTKGSSNPKAAAEAAATTRKQQGAAPRAGSRRLTASSSKTAAVIGVLPKVVAKESRGAPGRVAFARAWPRRPAAGGARVFASDGAVGPEPVSPKVSCFGAVLPETSSAAAGPPPGKQEEEEEERGGCWASVATALRGLVCCSSDPREDESGASGSVSTKATAPEPPPSAAVVSPPRPVAAGLGDLRRLASRRWPETMAAEGRGSV
ncbi:hypothetical protein BAE44_0000814 [Dichanthelium oligosanthes]|uniref:Uncharacterized protein n=1 Tax=Dichanthelium oligosanthes TaxID=888268 RepID=A0A1E5WLD5_9POAL|nr:hypothetical protein BAE44_0000814 [Dichanthelium oligosanthes]